MSLPSSLAILHFHLQPGGVTQVIRNHLLAWNSAWSEPQPLRVAVVHGGRAAGWDERLAARLPRLEVALATVPELEYDDLRETPPGDATGLASAIERALSDVGFDRETTLLHWHNHSVGRNAAAPGAIATLAERGHRQLVQIHDFAEDARPANYSHLRKALQVEGGTMPLYPLAKTIRYATLTGRDRRFLIAAGMPKDSVSVLPNPVHALNERWDAASARAEALKAAGKPSLRRWGLYPVRGIRRKNVGELLLWAAVSPKDVGYGVTLRPETPVEAQSYDAWKGLAEELDLNVVFDVGALPGIDFATNVAAADALFTTSVAEGFGMAFLETALARKPLLGRDLPEITADFRDEGLEFPGLVSSIRIPVQWIGEPGLDDLRRVYLEQCATYALDGEFEDAWGQHAERLRGDAFIDFGALLPSQQVEIIGKLVRDADARRELDDLNPEWAALRLAWEQGSPKTTAPATDARSGGLAAYSIERLGDTLGELATSLFRPLTCSKIRSGADSISLVREFLAPERFRPLRFVEFGRR